MASLVAQTVKNLTAMQGTQDQSLGREDALEKGMATPSITWRIPWTEEPAGPQAIGSQKSWTQPSTHALSYHTPPLWYLSPVVGPKGGQAAWNCRPG